MTNLCSGYGCNEVGIISFTYGDSPNQIESICPGVIVETGHTDDIFGNPQDPRTADYVHGRFG